MSINSKRLQRVLAGMIGAAILGASLKASPAQPTTAPVPPRVASFPIVFRSKDAKTGLEIRTTQTKTDEIVVEVKDAAVSIRKRIGTGSSETSLTTKGGSITVSVKGSVVSVRTRDGQVTGNLDVPASLAPVGAALARASAAAQGRALLTRLSLDPNSVAGHALLLTRALLQSADGDRSGADALADWSKKLASRVTVRPISQTQDGPEYCWDTYAISAIQIWESYLDCFKQCSSYNILCQGGCAFIYDLRAEGAFAWWLKCTAIRA